LLIFGKSYKKQQIMELEQPLLTLGYNGSIFRQRAITSPGECMEEGRPSATAIMAAIQRAEHLLWDDDPKIFQDPLALDLSGIASASALQARFEAFQRPF
jgi:hypothetical protein